VQRAVVAERVPEVDEVRRQRLLHLFE
jgi:hypothetical protein